VSVGRIGLVRTLAACVATAAMLVPVGALRAEEATVVAISVKGHEFQPAEVHAPANRPLTLKVKNLDSVPMEFESIPLRVEKVVAPNSEGIFNIRPLGPGSYEFFDDFRQKTRGNLIVE